MLIFSDDKPRLQRHFEKDKVLFAYHLGDLDEFYFDDCQWGVDYHERARIEEVILVYSGGETPTVLAFGFSERFILLLDEMLPLLPPAFYAHFQDKYRSKLKEHYKEQSLGTHLKMKLTDFKPIETAPNDKIIQLDESHLDLISQLYQVAYPDNYFTEKMLETKQYYGIMLENKLVAVTGVHVDSDQYKITVLGNFCVHPDFRGRNFGQKLISHQITNLSHFDKTICLNVKADNDPALKIYKKLGFETIHEYEEAYFSLK